MYAVFVSWGWLCYVSTDSKFLCKICCSLFNHILYIKPCLMLACLPTTGSVTRLSESSSIALWGRCMLPHPLHYKAFHVFSTNWMCEGSTSRLTCSKQRAVDFKARIPYQWSSTREKLQSGDQLQVIFSYGFVDHHHHPNNSVQLHWYRCPPYTCGAFKNIYLWNNFKDSIIDEHFKRYLWSNLKDTIMDKTF